MADTNKFFSGLKRELLGLTEKVNNERTYQDFFAYLALLSMGQEVHAYGTDYDEMKIKSILSGDSERERKWFADKSGLNVRYELENIRGAGLEPISSSGYHSSVGYVDEVSGIEDRSLVREYAPSKLCSCYVCATKRTLKENWQPLNFKIAQKTVDFIQEYLERDGAAQLEANFKRTPEEVKSLNAMVREMMEGKKAFAPVLNLVKKLKKDGLGDDEIKKLVKSHLTKVEVSDEDIFKGEMKLWDMKDNLEESMGDFCKAKGSNDIVDFSEQLAKSKFIRKEFKGGKWVYYYKDPKTGKVTDMDPPKDAEYTKDPPIESFNSLKPHQKEKFKITIEKEERSAGKPDKNFNWYAAKKKTQYVPYLNGIRYDLFETGNSEGKARSIMQRNIMLWIQKDGIDKTLKKLKGKK